MPVDSVRSRREGELVDKPALRGPRLDNRGRILRCGVSHEVVTVAREVLNIVFHESSLSAPC
jgi:hypothetical protein